MIFLIAYCNIGNKKEYLRTISIKNNYIDNYMENNIQVYMLEIREKTR